MTTSSTPPAEPRELLDCECWKARGSMGLHSDWPGAGYWNMIRIHFPEQFNRMCELSRRLGARLVKQDGARIFLDELRPETGKQQDHVDMDCSPLCEITSEQLAEPRGPEEK